MSRESNLTQWRALLPAVARHFDLSPQEVAHARFAAMSAPSRAAVCYKAIVDSPRPMRGQR